MIAQFDPRQQPVLMPPMDAPYPPAALFVSAADVERERRLNNEIRARLIAETRSAQGLLGVQLKEQMQDTTTALAMGQIVLDAEAHARGERNRIDLTDSDVSPSLKHALVKDMATSLRYRRPVYRRLAEYKHRQAIAETLTELLSHKLSGKEIAVISAAISGRAKSALLGTLDNSIKITATEYAAATLDFLGEKGMA